MHALPSTVSCREKVRHNHRRDEKTMKKMYAGLFKEKKRDNTESLNFTLEQAMEAQRETRDISLVFFLNLGIRLGWVYNAV